MGILNGKIIKYSSLLLFQVLLAIPVFVCGQESILKCPVSLSITNEPIDMVLDKLSKSCGVRFTYNPDDIAAQRRVTLNVKSQPLGEVLSKIFIDPSLALKVVGEQVIIYRSNAILPANNANGDKKQKARTAALNSTEPDINRPREKKVILQETALEAIVQNSPSHAPDTLYITRRDTIVRIDTLVKTDTLVMRDTVFVEKAKARHLRKMKQDVFSESLLQNQFGRKDHGFVADISGSYLLSEMLLSGSSLNYENIMPKLRTSGTKNLPGYSFGAGAGYRYKGWSVRSGVYYTRFLQRFNYNYQHETGGLFKTDTVETYYTLSGPDTSWFYITDSSWIDKQILQNNYREQNRFSYLEIPLSFSYTFYNNNFELYVSGGVIAGILPKAIGSFIDPEADYPALSLADISLNPFVLSVTGGAGVRFALNQQVDVFSEVAYRQQLSSLFKDYPVSAKFASFFLRCGLTYNF